MSEYPKCEKAGKDWEGCGDCENEDPNTCPAEAMLQRLQQPQVLAAAGNHLFAEIEKAFKEEANHGRN